MIKVYTKITKPCLYIWILLFVFLFGCNLTSPAPSRPTQAVTEAFVLSVTPVPTETTMPTPLPSPTETPLPTVPPEPTPTPTPESIFVSAPTVIQEGELEDWGRPELSGTVRFVDTTNFRIFYSLSGKDGVDIVDDNGNAIPDYVDEIGEILAYTWDIEIEGLGWRLPPSDEGRGGDDKLDVYLMDMAAGYLGMAVGDEEAESDRPEDALSSMEPRALSSYMVIENDYREYEHDLEERQQEDGEDLGAAEIIFDIEEVLRKTIAHELLHVIQFGYDAFEPDNWLWEASATWVEKIVYPDYEMGGYFTDLALAAPDVCQLAYAAGDYSGHWYSEWLFLKFLTTRYDDKLVRLIWEYAAEYDGYAPLIYALEDYGATLDEEIRAYHISALLRDFDTELGESAVRLEGVIEQPQTFIPTTGAGQMGADYIRLDISGVIAVHLHQLDQGYVVGIADDTAYIYELIDSEVRVDADAYEDLFVVVLNTEKASDITDCSYFPYMVSVSVSQDPDSPGETRSAVSYLQPQLRDE